MDRPALVPLLGWQQLLLAALAGFLAAAAPWAAGLGLVLLLWFIIGSRAAPLRHRVALAVAAVAVFGLGWAWSFHTEQARQAEAAAAPAWVEQGPKVRLRGRIAEAVTRPGRRLRIVLDDLERIHQDGSAEAMPGALRWTWLDPPVIPAEGARIVATLRLRPLHGLANQPGGDGYEQYWRSRGVLYTAFSVGDKAEAMLLSRGDALWEARLAVREKVFRHLIARGAPWTWAPAADTWQSQDGAAVSPGGAMAAALLLGERYFLDAGSMTLMKRADLAHSVALSGLHVACMALIGAGLAFLAGWLWPGIYLRVPRARLAALLACVLALVYVWLGGGAPSLVRAAVMFIFFGILLWMGRRSVIIDGLFLALAVICFTTPELTGDLRLVLSAASVAGIACVVPFLPGPKPSGDGSQKPRWRRWVDRSWRYLLGFLLVTLAVHLATLPLRVWYFGNLPLNPLANIIWLPLLGGLIMPVLVLGLALAALPWSWGAAQYAAAHVLGFGATLLDGMAAGLRWLDGHGFFGTVVTLRPTWPSWVGWWLLLVLALLWLERRRSGRDHLPRGWQALACVGGALMVAPPALAGIQAMRSEAVSLTILDVGQGQSVLVEGPGGVRALVDGGGFRSDFFDAGEDVVSPYLTRNRLPRLAYAVVSHGHTDHLKGLLFPLRLYDVGAFVRNSEPVAAQEEREELAAILARRKLPVRVAFAGDSLPLAEGLSFEVVHPSPEFEAGELNDSSLVLRLVWRGHPLALLPGDIEAKAVRAILDSGRDITAEVLIAPHHGGASSVNMEFYRAVGPRIAVASAGYLNQWRLPSMKLRSAMQKLDIPLIVTSRHGAVRMTWQAPGRDPAVQAARE